MQTRVFRRFAFGIALAFAWLPVNAQTGTGPGTDNIALANGLWFNGTAFEPRTVYSVDGRFTMRAPERIDAVLDLTGAFVVPPFAEAHNHNIGLGSHELDRESVERYLAAGVFYVQILGNLPLDAEASSRLGLDRPDGLDVAFAHGVLTATGGHPTALARWALAQGFYAGHTNETLHDHYFFTIDSEEDLDRKWTAILAQQPDILKTMLMFSDEFARRSADPAEEPVPVVPGEPTGRRERRARRSINEHAGGRHRDSLRSPVV